MRIDAAVCESSEEVRESEDADASGWALFSAARGRASARHNSIATKPKLKTGKIPNGEQTFL